VSFVRAAAVACALALAVGAVGCSDDDDDAAAGATDSGCPVEPARVGELLGYEVVVDEDRATAEACRFEPADLRGDEGNGVDEGEPSLAGAHVLVVERRIAGSSDGRDGYTAARDDVEVDVGPTEALADGVVEDGRGWVARVGRVVQVGVARDRRLVQVTVAEPTVDAARAEAVALDLALEALG
jgi:hypothetical protein